MRRHVSTSGAPARALTALLFVVSLSACMTGDDVNKLSGVFQGGGSRPDVIPVMRNAQLPFRYPSVLYAQKVQGNVTLRIFIDSLGAVHPESTIVVESSGYPALDSAAIKGSRELSFTPARKRDAPVAVTVLYPVYFRHPEAAPLPGDSVLKTAPTPVPPPK
jgi:TonB family protein